jgi:predicted  nucleic acid-binding Zn-ribbon protein
VSLNRLETDAPGFYSINFQDFDEMLVVVYESGIFSIVSTGIVWHHKKMWDDLAASIDINSIVVTTGDEGRYTLDTRTGRIL